MNKADVAKLVIYVTQLAPAQNFDEYTAAAWHDVLGKVPADFEQAREATARVARKEQWISPNAILGELMAIMPPRQHSNPAPAIEAPSKFEPNEDRSARIARGAALVRQALAEATPFRAHREERDVPENLRKAREAAAEYKAAKRRGDPEKLGRAGGQLMTQINQARKASA
jgi:hypothetical protein